MGDRGPPPDPHQAAKGFPGKRKSKALRAAEQAAKIAALLAPSTGAVADLPAMLQDTKYAGAAAVWRRMAPELRRTHRLPPESEHIFLQLCIYLQEWVEATEDLHSRGFSQHISTVAGGKMERRRPKVFDRQQAFQNVQLLSGGFGLTPMDMYALFKDQALAMQKNPGLFGDERRTAAPAPASEPAAGEVEETPAASRIGSIDRMKSAPPRPN